MDHLEHRSNRKGIIALVAASALVSSMALAANPHCPGNQVEATVNPDGTVTLDAHAAGFGDETILVEVSVDATVDVQCENPGGNVAPGQSFQTTATGSAEVDPSQSGQIQVEVTTDPIDVPEDSCPNAQWTAIPTFSFDNLVAVFYQAGEEVLVIQCDFNDGTQEFECECL